MICAMKSLLASVFAFLPLAAASMAASDADVTIVKAYSVLIEPEKVTIVADAKSRITLIHGDPDPADAGDQWRGMPVTRPYVIGNKITFVIKRAPNDPLPEAWKETLRTAKDLQDGKEVGRIGFYEPDIVIKGNMLISMSGRAFLYPKSK
jgi:hypothetical protein